jgi:hypothetical protein
MFPRLKRFGSRAIFFSGRFPAMPEILVQTSDAAEYHQRSL